MIRLTVDLTREQAAALAEGCRRFQYADAQHLLRHSRNIEPDDLCQAVTSMLDALTAAGIRGLAMPVARPDIGVAVTAESDTHVTIAIDIEKAELARHSSFLDKLLAAAAPRRA